MGALRRGLIARLPAVPGETVQGIGFRLVSLLHVLWVLIARVGIRKTLSNGACGVRRGRTGVKLCPPTRNILPIRALRGSRRSQVSIGAARRDCRPGDCPRSRVE
eukprot:4932235-Pleurochrysis_carterae.AAC.2